MPGYGGSTAVWAGSPITWGASGLPAPPCTEPETWGGVAIEWDGDPISWPSRLYGEHAQWMLDYLPDYYRCSDHVRAILQAEGYEIDQLANWVGVLGTVTQPETCPEWALVMWEQMLGTGGRG